MTGSHTCLALMTLTVLRNGGHLLRSMSSTWNLSDVFLKIRWRLWDLGRKPTEVKGRPPHIPMAHTIVHMTDNWWYWPWSPGEGGLLSDVSTAQYFYSLPYYSLGQHDLMYSPRLKCIVWLYLLRAKYLHLFEILYRILSVIPYLFIQAFISMNSWIFTLSISTL